MPTKALSLTEVNRIVQDAWWNQFQEDDFDAPYPLDVFMETIVVSGGPGKLYQVTWVFGEEGDVEFAPRDEWVKVEREYVAKALKAFSPAARYAFEGGLMAVKSFGPGDGGEIVGGYEVLWGSSAQKDLYGEWFTPETDLMEEYYAHAPAHFHHGRDALLGKSVLGHRISALKDDVGLFVKHWLDKQATYFKFVEPLLSMKALYYSPATAPHLWEKAADGRLIRWPIIEDTFTTVPVQFRLMDRPVEELKAAWTAAGQELPDGYMKGLETVEDVPSPEEGTSEEPSDAAPGGAGEANAVTDADIERERLRLLEIDTDI